jgi:hypothetical protein
VTAAAQLAAWLLNSATFASTAQEDSLADPDQINADQLAFWNGSGGHTWVARQEHTDITGRR